MEPSLKLVWYSDDDEFVGGVVRDYCDLVWGTPKGDTVYEGMCPDQVVFLTTVLDRLGISYVEEEREE